MKKGKTIEEKIIAYFEYELKDYIRDLERGYVVTKEQKIAAKDRVLAYGMAICTFMQTQFDVPFEVVGNIFNDYYRKEVYRIFWKDLGWDEETIEKLLK